MNGDSVFGNHISHLLDLLLQVRDALSVLSDCCFGLIELFLEDLLFGRHSLKLLRQGFGGGFELFTLFD